MWWRNEAPKMRRRLAKEHIMTCNIHAMHPDQGSCDMFRVRQRDQYAKIRKFWKLATHSGMSRAMAIAVGSLGFELGRQSE